MNLSKLLFRFAAAALALGGGLPFAPAVRAQTQGQFVENRYLFIFDTSADMKRRVPAVRTELNDLLATSMGGRLRAGDSLGVWTFDRTLCAGRFPLQTWRPENASAIAAGINKFVAHQRYANTTRFSALQPTLNEVIHDSTRLTVLIFCDGEDEIQWTPYDAGVNRIFRERRAEQKRAKQPFILVFRTQLGRYVGCTMNFPPGMLNLPNFPPLPPPPAPTNPPPAVAAKPPPTAPPLILIGTKVETNRPSALPPAATNTPPEKPATAAPAAPPAKSVLPPSPSPAAAPVPAVSTHRVVRPGRLAPPTNAAPMAATNPAPVPAVHSVVSTNTNAAAPEANTANIPGAWRRRTLLIGAALLVAAGVLAVLAFFRARRAGRGSLISRSMWED